MKAIDLLNKYRAFLLFHRTNEAIRTWGCLQWLGCCVPFAHTAIAWLRASRVQPEAFPLQPPREANAPLSVTNMRRIRKLQEYLQENPGKIAKVGFRQCIPPVLQPAPSHALFSSFSTGMQVSRRLAQRTKQFLNKGQMGMVLIGVQTYIEILDKALEEECSYSFAYVSRELVQQPDALVGGFIQSLVDIIGDGEQHPHRTATCMFAPTFRS